MDNKKNGIPKLRFPGFTGAWEQRKFFDNIEKVIDFRGRTPKKLGMEWSAEGYTALSALNVKDGYIDFTADVHYANQDLYDKWMAGNELYKGQVLFTTEAPMGNVAQVPDNRKYVLSQRTIAFNVDKTKVTNDFLAVLLRSQNVQHTLKSLASGGTAQGVSQKSLSQLKVILPINPKEQQEIGNFFNHFDSLIALHQRKLEHLQEQKKGLLQKMFPKNGEVVPEVRFPGFTDAWEQRKLGEVVERRIEKRRQSERYPRLAFASGQGVIPLSERKTNNREQLTKDEFTKKYLVTELDDIVYNPANVKYGAIDRNKYGRGLISPIYVTFTTGEVPGFIERIVKSHDFKQKALRFEEGTVTKRQSVNPEDLVTINILVASQKKEQKKISLFFDNIDTLIALHQRKLEHLELMKKGLLQQMFV